MPEKFVKRLFLAGTIVWTVLIIFLTIAPSENLPSLHIGLNDKVLHFIFFYFYGFLVAGSVYSDKNLIWKFVIVLLFINLFGMSLEYMQKSIPGRTYEWIDILFNFMGTLAGATNFLVISRKIFKG